MSSCENTIKTNIVTFFNPKSIDRHKNARLNLQSDSIK